MWVPATGGYDIEHGNDSGSKYYSKALNASGKNNINNDKDNEMERLGNFYTSSGPTPGEQQQQQQQQRKLSSSKQPLRKTKKSLRSSIGKAARAFSFASPRKSSRSSVPLASSITDPDDGLPTHFPTIGSSEETALESMTTTMPVVAPTGPSSSGTTGSDNIFENPIKDDGSIKNDANTNNNYQGNNDKTEDNEDKNQSDENTDSAPTDSVAFPSMPPTESPQTMPPTSDQPFSEWTWSAQNSDENGQNSETLLKGIPGIDQSFGQAVALSDDGETLAVGSPDALGNGIVRIYQLEPTSDYDGGGRQWKHTEALLGRQLGDKFGTTVALSKDGRVLAIGEPERDGTAGDKTGSVRTYVYSPSGYVSRGPDLEGTGASDHFGLDLALSKDGKRLAIGAPYQDNSLQSSPSGSSSSSQKQRLSNGIGGSGVRNSGNNENNSNSNDKNRLVSGTVLVYEWSIPERKWIPLGPPLKGTNHLDWFGWSLDLNDDGSVLCVGSPRNLAYGGHVRCFQLEDETSSSSLPTELESFVTDSLAQWVPIGDVIRNDQGPIRYDDNFGATVKVSTDPTGGRHRVAIGSPGKNGLESEAFDRGQVAVYEFNPAAAERGWVQLGREVITPWQEVDFTNEGRDFRMGFSLDLRYDLLAVGMPGANDNTGMVEIFEFQRDSWQWVRNPSLFEGRISLSSYYGAAISMTPRGDFVVGSPQSEGNIGSVHVYHRQK
eukprot:jgi/Psemu1/324085/estExt_fgenesh1_pg.C_1190008